MDTKLARIFTRICEFSKTEIKLLYKNCPEFQESCDDYNEILSSAELDTYDNRMLSDYNKLQKELEDEIDLFLTNKLTD